MSDKEFQKDLKRMSLDEALKKHNKSLKDLFTCNQNRKLSNRWENDKNISNVCKIDEGLYTVQKYQNGEKVHYGTYHNLDEVEFVVNELEKVDWDKNSMVHINEKLALSLNKK